VKSKAHSKQQGLTLIEVLVSLVVVSLGILGLIALQSKSLQNTQLHIAQSTAVILSYGMSESLHADSAVAENGGYDISLPSSGCSDPSGPTGLALGTVVSWWGDITANLGSDACGSIDCTTTSGICVLTIENGSTLSYETRVTL